MKKPVKSINLYDFEKLQEKIKQLENIINDLIDDKRIYKNQINELETELNYYKSRDKMKIIKM